MENISKMQMFLLCNKIVFFLSFLDLAFFYLFILIIQKMLNLIYDYIKVENKEKKNRNN